MGYNMWDKFDGIIALRDELREHLVAHQDEPTDDNMTRISRTLADFHVLLTGLYDDLQMQRSVVDEVPSLVDEGRY